MRDVLQGLIDFLGKQKAKISDKVRPDIDLAKADKLFALLLASATGAREPDEKFAANLKAAGELAPSDDSARARVLRGSTLYHRDWQVLNEERAKMRWKWHEYFKTYDLMLLPVYPLAPHLHMHDTSSDQRTYQINGKTVTHAHMLFWAGLTGVVYLPATAAPGRLHPIGASRRRADRRPALRRPHDDSFRKIAGTGISGFRAAEGF